jgi:low affinity Fe/Cu permease
MINHLFTAVSSRIAGAAGKPVTFILAVGFIVIWAATGPLFAYSDTWQLVVNTATTIVTFLMVFLIQNSQNRDAAAMQAKLDEIIRTLDDARNGFIGIEHKTDTEVEQIRKALEDENGNGNKERRASTNSTLAELLKR